ncbi:hypothetical protein [Streptomyces albipurpureus]|uniref:FG-GAP repeat protein n=1 Tax=Streptomyces albipurpureus TaxID=2897419 RepID=A0ABT0UZ63_9ACTN|nr:hypothetical protein [Streptomyces sp. CWNU-1]MCM2393264.1 hypothetical protein [Streptomyces sp. CWNU-1]
MSDRTTEAGDGAASGRTSTSGESSASDATTTTGTNLATDRNMTPDAHNTSDTSRASRASTATGETTASGGLRFLPWVRDGLVGGLSEAGEGTGPARARAGVKVGLTVARSVDGGTAAQLAVPPVTVTLLGPGDVTGLDAAQIIRAFPEPGTEGVETTGFASVEFDRPDLPWMFSPGGPDARGRLRPWLVLVVVAEEAAVFAPPAAEGALPSLTCPVSSLPDLAHSWDWAHAQLVTAEGTDPLDVLGGPSELSLSRIICPTPLAGATRYVAALVPAYEAGQLAGLGLPLGGHATGPLTDAWKGTAGKVTLPVYHTWRFGTGQSGDFEYLARKLSARAFPEAGSRPLDLSRAGVLPLTPGAPDATGWLGSALRAPGPRPPWPIGPAWRAAMRVRFSPATDRLPPPLYGAAYLGTQGPVTLPPDGAGPSWLTAVNLEPQHRAVAALGARIIQNHQEDLVAAVQEQAAALREANGLLGLARLARGAGSALHRRRIARTSSGGAALAPGMVADTAPGEPGDAGLASPGATRAFGDAELLALTRPVHDLVDAPQGTPARPQGAAGVSELGQAAQERDGHAAMAARSLAELVDGNPGVAAATTTAFRRTARSAPGPQGAGTPPADAGAAVTALATGAATPVPPAQLPTGAVSDSVLRDAVGNPLPLERLSAAFLSSADPWWLTPPPPPPGPVTLWPLAASSAPAFVGDRLFQFVGTNSGLSDSSSLFELVPMGTEGERVWRDHCVPEVYTSPSFTGGLAVVPGQRRVFSVKVVGLGWRELAERRWDGDRWIWVAHPMPDGRSPHFHAGPAIAGDSLWITTAQLGLAQLNLSTGEWTQHGDPGYGVLSYLSGTPAPMPSGRQTYVMTTHGGLYERRITSSGIGEWHSVPTPPSAQLQSIVPNGSTGIRALGNDGQLWEYRPGLTPLWRSYPRPLGVDITAIAAPSGEYQQVTLANGAWAQGRNLSASPAWTVYRWADRPAHRGFPPTQDPQAPDRAFVTLADGRVARLTYNSAGTTAVQDFGIPSDPGGQGNWIDPALGDRRRFAPKVGLFGSVLVSHLDLNPPPGASTMRSRTGSDLGPDAAPRGGWSADRTVVPGVALSSRESHLVTATADLTGSGRPDLVVLTRLDPGMEHRLTYRVGTDLGPDGTVTGGWQPTIVLPEGMNKVHAVDIALADLDGDGRPELIVAYVTGDVNSPRLAYRIGWRLDATGRATGGWSLTHGLPQPGGPVYQIGIDVADVTGDDTPDLVLVTAESGTPRDRITHRIGRSVNRRGLVTGGWTDAVPFGGASADGTRLSALSLAAADLTGSGRPDLMILRGTVATPVHQAALSVAIDLDAAGVPTSWRGDTPLPGGASPRVSGASVTVADLDPALTQRRADMGTRFIEAAIRHQTVVAAAQALTRQPTPPAVPVSEAAAVLRAALNPRTTVPERALARIEVDGVPLSDVVPDGVDPLRTLVTGVEFPEPMYEPLRELSPDHLLGGAQDIPAETVTLLETDPAFVEAYLLGLNTELGRELLWREVPVDLSTTFFRQFWDVRGSTPDGSRPSGAPVADIPPIAQWGGGALGTHATGVGGPGEGSLVLVVRGELLRRYPNAAVTARRASWTGQPGGPRTVTVGAPQLPPLFSARFDPDIQVFCFPLTRAAAVGGGTDPGWFFAFWEQPSALRFGVDEGEPAPADPYNSAHLAAALVQRPVFVAIHADDMLAPASGAVSGPVSGPDPDRDAPALRPAPGGSRHRPDAPPGPGAPWPGEPLPHDPSANVPEDRQS